MYSAYAGRVCRIPGADSGLESVASGVGSIGEWRHQSLTQGGFPTTRVHSENNDMKFPECTHSQIGI